LSNGWLPWGRPFRRTAVGFDTQDHTIDIEVTPQLAWRWRDEQELANHVAEGFYTDELAEAARLEGKQAITAIQRLEHPCTRGWSEWTPPPEWQVPSFVAGWDTDATHILGQAPMGLRS
jgi:hypothetical protein